MVLQAPRVVVLHDLESVQQFAHLDLNAALFAHFALRRLAQRFAQLDHTSRQTPIAAPGRIAALDQEHSIVFANHDANAANGTSGIFARIVSRHSSHFSRSDIFHI